MSLFKKTAVKRATKKWAKQLLDAFGPPNSDMLRFVKDWIRLTESIAGYGYSIVLKIDTYSDWTVLFYHIICLNVFSELKFFKTIGSDEDLKICQKYVVEEITIWAQKHGCRPADIV
jgi:hypothetical protein